ncbi:MAG: hypothetical protein PHI97_31540 [Desulfobulbus sp.]|nr:hypothetical protein [Desulfobulbus sp.]
MGISKFHQSFQPLSAATAAFRAIVGIDHQCMKAKLLLPAMHHPRQSIYHEVCGNLALAEPEMIVTSCRREGAEWGMLCCDLKIVIATVFPLSVVATTREWSDFYSGLGIQGNSSNPFFLVGGLIDAMNFVEDGIRFRDFLQRTTFPDLAQTKPEVVEFIA